MQAKTLLSRIRRQESLLDAVEMESRKIADDIEMVMILQDSKGQQELLLSLKEYNEKITVTRIRLLAMKEQGKEIIARLSDPQEQAVLYNRYINGMSWNDIEKAMPYSWSGLFKLERRAMKHANDLSRG
jgi:hypothetical protein